VVQVIVADVAVTPLDVTLPITGIDTAPDTERSSSAGAAQGADPETEEQVTDMAVAAVLSHSAIST
jgi:hypothetical protein